MVKKGYDAELRTKKELEKTYGKGTCLKIAIGGSSDFLVVSCGELIKFVEVKETKKKKYYPLKREKDQFEKLIELGKRHKVNVEVWIYFKRGPGKPVIKHIMEIYEHV